jgi:hypothetical protein
VPYLLRTAVRPLAARLLAGALFVLLVACGHVAPTDFSRDIDDLLGRGDAYARSLATAGGAGVSDEGVIALGYLERARLGIGSPFRLIAYVQRDERLSPASRELLSYALLRVTLQERGYQVDPAVLEVLRMINVPTRTSVGEHHLELITRTIADAPSALSGERAARMGYLLAGTERTVETSPEPIISYAAAVIADRRRAREDATELLRMAAQLRVDPLELLEDWRRELRFRVEQPALVAVTANDEISETVRGTQVARSLRVLAQRLSAPAGRGYPPRYGAPSGSWLPPGAAERLHRLAMEHDYPAQAPVAVAVMINREALVNRPGLTRAQRAQRNRFVETAINEETLVAGVGAMQRTGAGAGARVPLTALQAAVFMRGWNQEEPWLPGDPAPSSRDLENRYGLASFTFDPAVPEGWRPYYRRMVGRALADVQRVLPTATLRGLNVRVGGTGNRDAALALHDPRTRTLIIPPTSGAGTIAHEIAHDLDWQLARKRYGRRGTYATDLVVARREGDRLAMSMAGLHAAFARDPADGAISAHDTRAAEVFARGMDWLIAASLASEGRTGGYTTSFQDAAIPGYGTARSPQIDGNAVPSLLGILEQIAPVPAEQRQWATEVHGPGRTLTTKELVRVLGASAREGEPFERFAALETARTRALEGLGAASCRMTPSPETRRQVTARQRAIRSAVAAVARGIVIDGVRAVAVDLPETASATSVNEYLMWKLDGGPEPTDSVVHLLQPVADELILRASELTRDAGVAPAGFRINGDRALCGGNPFATPIGGSAAFTSAPRSPAPRAATAAPRIPLPWTARSEVRFTP